MKKELEKTYNPADIEDRLYAKWVNKKYFHAEVNANKKPYTIVIPPPNITGQLHMGHALDNTRRISLFVLNVCRDMKLCGCLGQTTHRLQLKPKLLRQ